MYCFCSPVERCVQTLEKIKEGASWKCEIIKEDFFAPSAPFIIDLALAIEEYKKVGGPKLFNHQITQKEPHPGMRSTAQGVADLLQKLLHFATDKGKKKGKSLFVLLMMQLLQCL